MMYRSRKDDFSLNNVIILTQQQRERLGVNLNCLLITRLNTLSFSSQFTVAATAFLEKSFADSFTLHKIAQFLPTKNAPNILVLS